MARACQFCQVKESDQRHFYVCPRCEAVYCSLDCYKCEAHSQCSELFYRNWVLSSLSNNERSPSSSFPVFGARAPLPSQLEGDRLDEEEVRKGTPTLSVDVRSNPELKELLESDERVVDQELYRYGVDVGSDDLFELLTDEEKANFESLVARYMEKPDGSNATSCDNSALAVDDSRPVRHEQLRSNSCFRKRP